MGLPFASGHVLGLRRWTASSVGDQFTSIWHRNPVGRWTFYESTDCEVACTRYFGADVERVREGPIDLEWKAPDRLRVRTGDGAVEWEIETGSTAATRMMSSISSVVPVPAWRSGLVLKAMGATAGRVLGVGKVQLTGTTSNQQHFDANPLRIWYVTASRAVVEDEDLSTPGMQAKITVSVGAPCEDGTQVILTAGTNGSLTATLANGVAVFDEASLPATPVTALQNTNQLLPITAVTAAGTVNSSSDTIHYLVDSQQPTIEITNPTDGATFTQGTSVIVMGFTDINQLSLFSEGAEAGPINPDNVLMESLDGRNERHDTAGVQDPDSLEAPSPDDGAGPGAGEPVATDGLRGSGTDGESPLRTGSSTEAGVPDGMAFLPDEQDQPQLSFDPAMLDPHQPLPAISA